MNLLLLLFIHPADTQQHIHMKSWFTPPKFNSSIRSRFRSAVNSADESGESEPKQ